MNYDEWSRPAASSQSPGPVPLALHANVFWAHPDIIPAATPPPTPESLNLPATPLSPVAPPVQAQPSVADPSANVVTEPQARTTGPGADARSQLMSSTRAMGNAPGERAAHQTDDTRVLREAPGSVRESQGMAYEQAAVGAVSESQAGATDFAFGGRLVPVVTAQEPARGNRTDLQPSLADKPFHPGGLSSLPGSVDPVGEKVVAAVEATSLKTSYRLGAAPPAQQTEDAAPAERERKLAAAHTGDGEPVTTAARTVSEPPRLAQESAAGGVRPKGDPARPERASALAESEAPKTPAATRDIKLEVASEGQRVEVRLTEHGGDVHVEVRTPDTHLAGELRENLPDLSSRLEHTGLRPEEWHATTPVSGEWHRQEHSTSASSGDANGQPRQDTRERQGDPEPRQTKAFEEQPNRKEKGKEFAWFMSSLH
ncbi:MAG TPA: hypothetical protein VGZ73_32690 [Bryobacteraceae bacterium]|nr:hypothetical protein [Bryobacteraceae bacterium]